MNRGKLSQRVKRRSLIVVQFTDCDYFAVPRVVAVYQMLMGKRLPLVECPLHIGHIAYKWDRPLNTLEPRHKARFDSYCKRDVSSNCLLWTGLIDRKGYGIFSFGASGIMRAHRAAWQFEHGPISNGLHVCHKCDVRNCVNTEHLFLGTQQDNNTDKISKGRQPHGSDIWASKLTATQVLEIRELLKTGVSQTMIARKFGIAPSNISVIASGKSWKWLKGEGEGYNTNEEHVESI